MTSIIVNNHGDNDSSDNNGKATGLTTAGGRPGQEPSFVYCSHHLLLIVHPHQVEDQGRNLTGSQRQLLCLARILLVRPTVRVSHHTSSHPIIVIIIRRL